ncbi:ACP phosphodiesterase [Chryseosolibacter indicus]|uniref:DUF479 domain-containing protein n=1 Tax=Chryseosolibacter indicus TaxID=2782351 RepID=A0ABS5VNV9_9BACT|nr:ACP phosphodiesterase [Chryseosolibacter indicus]MBT1703140.1 DUF479 domain-containing protein [Chryseosolibacter indicus]
MNFLAHAYLSGGNKEILVGNFIADFVKGKQQLALFDAPIVKGIELHRTIDSFTDTHAIVRETKVKLREKYNHYSGVIVDVFFDHFLAKNWHHYHSAPLTNFASDVYNTIQSYNDVLPVDVKYMLPYMIRGNWLLNYAKVEGVARTLSGMANRTKFRSRMDEAVGELEEHYDYFHAQFEMFFPLLVAHAKEWLRENYKAN